jgi:hypothetical protein
MYPCPLQRIMVVNDGLNISVEWVKGIIGVQYLFLKWFNFSFIQKPW